MVEFTLEGGILNPTPGGDRPSVATPLTAMSIAAPHPGFSGHTGDEYWDPTTPRLWFTFTPETTGRVYVGAWLSHWVDGAGDPVEGLLMDLNVAPLPTEEWTTGESFWHYEWRPGIGSLLVDVVAGQTYMLLGAVSTEAQRPVEAVGQQLVLFLSEVQGFTPWQSEPAIPTVLQDGVPYTGSIPAPVDTDDVPDQRPDDRVRSGRYFVGRN